MTSHTSIGYVTHICWLRHTPVGYVCWWQCFAFSPSGTPRWSGRLEYPIISCAPPGLSEDSTTLPWKRFQCLISPYPQNTLFNLAVCFPSSVSESTWYTTRETGCGYKNHQSFSQCFPPELTVTLSESLPQDLRHCSTLSPFKAKLKTFLFSQYFHHN